MLWCLLPAVVMTGCSMHRTAQKEAPVLSMDQSQRERALRGREAELAGLRADVATSRIAAAKKEAEVQELREQVLRLRQELGGAYQQLAEERAESGKARGSTVKPLPEDAALGADRVPAAAVLSSPRSTMDTMLRNLAKEVEGLKRQLQTVQDAQQAVDEPQARETGGRAGSGRSPHVGQPPIQSLAIGFVGVTTQSVTVEVGDTLADLAQRYHTSEAQLRQVNVLEETSLTPGQVLLVPVPSVESP